MVTRGVESGLKVKANQGRASGEPGPCSEYMELGQAYGMRKASHASCGALPCPLHMTGMPQAPSAPRSTRSNIGKVPGPPHSAPHLQLVPGWALSY